MMGSHQNLLIRPHQAELPEELACEGQSDEGWGRLMN